MPVSAGRRRSSWVLASRPPAEAPMPTTGKDSLEEGRCPERLAPLIPATLMEGLVFTDWAPAALAIAAAPVADSPGARQSCAQQSRFVVPSQSPPYEGDI